MKREGFFQRKRMADSDRAYLGSGDPAGTLANEDFVLEVLMGYSETSEGEAELDHWYLNNKVQLIHEPRLMSDGRMFFKPSKLGVVRYVPADTAERAELELDGCWHESDRLLLSRKLRAARSVLERQVRRSLGLADRGYGAELWARVNAANLKQTLKNAARLTSPADAQTISVGSDDPRPALFAQMLVNYKNVETLQDLGGFLAAILEARPVSELENWFTHDWHTWLIERRIALAALIEAAVQLAVPGLDKVFATILTNHAAPFQVASVAAQRIRMIKFQENESRNLWPHLKFWLERWMKEPATEEYATLALPSGLYLDQEDAPEWFAGVIKRAQPKIAMAAAIGVLTWLQQQDASTSKKLGGLFTEAILLRLKNRTSHEKMERELYATLVWALGGTVTENELPAVAEILVQSFQAPGWTEDAAAVRAGRLMYRRFGLAAKRIIANKFGGYDSETCHRFDLAVMHPSFAR